MAKTGLKKKYIKLAGKGGFKKAWRLQKAAEKKRGSARKATVKKKVSRKKNAVRKAVRKIVKTVKKAVKKTKKRVYKESPKPKKRKGNPVAKKKKSTKKSYSRRNPGKGIADKLMEGAAVAGGAIGAGLAANQIPVQDPRMKAAAVMAVGIFLSTLKPMRAKLPQMVSMGITAAGALSLFKQFAPNLPVMAGENDMYYLPDTDENAMLGVYDDTEPDEYLGQNAYDEDDEFDDVLDGESVDIAGEDEDWVNTQNF